MSLLALACQILNSACAITQTTIVDCVGQMSAYARLLRNAIRFRQALWGGAAYFEDERNAEPFKRLLIDGGPVFIKIGQWMAQRPDVFPEQFIVHLQSLQREAPQHSFAQTRLMVCRALGIRSLDDAFEEFDDVPIASGSIAQVYRAKYRGRDVVLKVRHPNIEERVRNDLLVLRKAVRIGVACNNYHCRVIDFDRVMREMLAQCNMAHERDCINIIAQNFVDNPMVHFPQPVFANDDVLIETFARGVEYGHVGNSKYDTFEYRSDAERDEARLLCKKVTMAVFLQMILHDALLHADLHRGNLLYHIERVPADDEGDERLRAHLTMLDLGIVVKLNDVQMDAVNQLITGLFAVHGQTVVDALAKVTMQNNDFTAEKMAAFARECIELTNKMDERRRAENGVDVPRVMADMLRLLHKHRLLIDGNMIRIMIDFILVNEGRKNHEQNNLMHDAVEWVLFGSDGDAFPITRHLIQIPLAVDRREMHKAGRVQRDDNKVQGESVRSLSNARSQKFMSVGTLSDAMDMKNGTLLECGSVVSKQSSVGVKRVRRRRVSQTSQH